MPSSDAIVPADATVRAGPVKDTVSSCAIQRLKTAVHAAVDAVVPHSMEDVHVLGQLLACCWPTDNKLAVVTLACTVNAQPRRGHLVKWP